MIQVVISPAKKLNFDTSVQKTTVSSPQFLEKTKVIINNLKKLDVGEIKKLMKLSDQLGQLNFERFQKFDINHHLENSQPAADTFNGDTYTGLSFKDFT